MNQQQQQQQQHNKPQSLRSHNYLRSRGRRLYSELFVEEDEIPIENSDQIDPLWSLSGTFSTPNHAKPIDLYNSSDANIPRFPEHDYTTPPFASLPVEEQQQEQGNAFFTTLLPLFGFCFLIALCRCSGGGAPGPEYHRGHQIRENALRIWAMQRRKAKRREATPEERKAKIQSRVCTQKVVSKDPKTDRCQLGDVNAPLPQQQEDALTQLESKQSTDTADTLPLEFDEDCESRDEMPMESSSNHIENFDDDDEDVCPICLDGFDVGDTVMFARDLSCTHVFHEECLLPWLLERRENECPSCREALVEEESDSEIDEEEESKNETESNRDSGTICGSCHISNTESEDNKDGLVDLERGDAALNDTTTYFIVKGRVVAETKHSNLEQSFDTASTDGSSFHDCEETCDATTTETNSLLHNRQLQRPRALSVTFIDKKKSDLSIPFPLVRVSQSLPANYIVQSKRSKQAKCCDDCKSSISTEKVSASRNLQLYDDENHTSQFPGLHTRFYDSPSSDDSSDEDDAICRMVHGHKALAGPKNASSIFHTRS